MVKTFCFDRNIFILSIFIIVLISYICISYYLQNICIQCTINKEKNMNLEKKENFAEQKQIQQPPQQYQQQPPQQQYQQQPNNIIQTVQFPTAVVNDNPQSQNALDRIYNPLRYPYKSDYFYDQNWYPNLELPFQVIGCGSRTQPCLGGTQVPIYNPPVSIDISNRNIAPVNISTRGPLGQPQQLGILYKVFGKDNDVLPLFGRRRYPNDSRYDYYTIMGQFGVKVPIIAKNRNDELGTNDIVFVKGRSDPYTVTIYKTDFPDYIPYV